MGTAGSGSSSGYQSVREERELIRDKCHVELDSDEEVTEPQVVSTAPQSSRTQALLCGARENRKKVRRQLSLEALSPQLRRLEAQRNELNSKVRLLREASMRGRRGRPHP